MRNERIICLFAFVALAQLLKQVLQTSYLRLLIIIENWFLGHNLGQGRIHLKMMMRLINGHFGS